MLRLLASHSLGTLLGGGRAPQAHQAVLRNRLARDQAFADSGFWDFALLSLYDYAVRRLVLGGVTALSELGWTERALVGSARALNFAPSPSPLAPARALSKVFAHLGQALALALAGALALALSAEGGPLPLALSDAPGSLGGARALLADLREAGGPVPPARPARGLGRWDWATAALAEGPAPARRGA